MSKYAPGIDNVNVFGKARHGHLKGTTLTLDVDGTVYTTSQYTGTGDTLYIYTGHGRINRTAQQAIEDAASHLEWRNDCVLYSYNRCYSVDNRSACLGHDAVLYSDANGNNWAITFSQSGNSFIVKLKNLFGRFFGYHAPDRNVQLASQTVTPISGSGIKIFYPEKHIYQNYNGSKILLHVYSTKVIDGGANSNLEGLQEIWEVTISGNGFVPTQASEDGQLGDGITATFEQYKDYDACYSVTFVNETTGGWDTAEDITYSYTPDAAPYPTCEGQAVTATISTVKAPTGSPQVSTRTRESKSLIKACYDENGDKQLYHVLYKSGTADQLTVDWDGSTSYDYVTPGEYILGNGNTCVFDAPPSSGTYQNIVGTAIQTYTFITAETDVKVLINDVEKARFLMFQERVTTDRYVGPDSYFNDTESSRLVLNGETIESSTDFNHEFEKRVVLSAKTITTNVVNLVAEVIDDATSNTLESRVQSVAYGATSDELVIESSANPDNAKSSFNPKTKEIDLVPPGDDQPVYL